MPLSRHSVGTYQKKSSHTSHQGTLSQSSQLAEPLWTDPGQKSGISVCEQISTLKKKKKRRQGTNCQTFSQILAHKEKATTAATTTTTTSRHSVGFRKTR